MGIALVSTAKALWLPAKAQLAQVLLDRAWSETQRTGEPNAPWPDADHYPIARLAVPSLGIEQVVLSGDSGAVLAFAPGMNREAQYQFGGAKIISGHRDTHFRFLQELQQGDELTLESIDHIERFKIVSTRVIDARQEGLYPSENPEGLYLVTCYPFDAVSTGGDQRYVVRAEPIKKILAPIVGNQLSVVGTESIDEALELFDQKIGVSFHPNSTSIVPALDAESLAVKQNDAEPNALFHDYPTVPVFAL
jgi:sortase A